MINLSSFFGAVMQREGKVVTNSLDVEILVFFRKNPDKNIADDRLTIFYRKESPLFAGEMITFESRQYLVLNKESPENAIYNKSDLVAAFTSVVIPLNNSFFSFKGVMSKFQGGTFTQTGQGDFLKGYYEILTQPTSDLQGLKKDDLPYVITNSNVYQFSNYYENNGIAHIVCEMTNESATYNTEVIYKDLEVNEQAKIKLQKTATFHNLKYPVEDLSAIFISENPDIIEITKDGLATGISEGTAEIKAVYSGNEYTVMIVVIGELPTFIYLPDEVNELGQYMLDDELHTLSAYLFDSESQQLDTPATFEVIDVEGLYDEYKFVVTGSNTATIKKTNWWQFKANYVKVQVTMDYNGYTFEHIWDIRDKFATW